MWEEITYPFPNFNSGTVEVWEWISNFIPCFIVHVITCPCWVLKLNHVSQRGHSWTLLGLVSLEPIILVKPIQFIWCNLNYDWEVTSEMDLVNLQTIPINTLRPRQNGCDFSNDIFKWIFLNENVWILIKISLFLRVQLTISQHCFR